MIGIQYPKSTVWVPNQTIPVHVHQCLYPNGDATQDSHPAARYIGMGSKACYYVSREQCGMLADKAFRACVGLIRAVGVDMLTKYPTICCCARVKADREPGLSSR